MKLALSRWVVVALATVLVPIAWVPGTADKPTIRVALEVDALAIQGVPEGVEITRISSADVTDKGLGKYDALIVSQATFDAALADGRLGALKKFVDGHRALAIVESDGSSLTVLDANIPLGGDVPMHGDEPLASHAGSAYLRGVSGTRHAFVNAFSTTSELNARFVSDFSAWLAALADFHPGRGTASADTPSDWSWIYSTNYCYTVSPYGQICYYATWYRNHREAVPLYDWWDVRMETATTPGYYLYGNGWRTDMTWMTANTDYYVGTNTLDQYGPSTRSIGSTQHVYFEVGMLAGILNADITSTLGTGYYANSVDITQASDRAYNDVYVRNAYWYDSVYTRNPVTSYSGWSERIDTTQNGGCYKVPYVNKAQWWDYGAGSYYQTWISSWRNVCP